MWRAMFLPLLVQLPVHFLLILSILKVEVTHAGYAKPGCNYTCGDVKILFPFGIGVGCFLDPWYEIECKASPNSNGSTSKKPFLSQLKFEVVNISVGAPGYVIVSIPPMNSCRADTHQQLNLRGSPYQLSRDDNILVMEGCPGSVVVVNQSKKIMAGCATVCNNNNDAEIQQPNDCYGVRCCQAPLPTDIYSNFVYPPPLQFYGIDFINSSSRDEHQNCLVATLIKSGRVNEYLSSSDRAYYNAPVLLEWSLERKLRDEYKSPHAICYDYGDATSRCYCKHGYYGNPYIFNGCQVTRECMECRGYCYGTWDLEGRLISSSVYCEKKPELAAILGLSISFGMIVLVIGLYGLYRFVKRRREMKRRAKFFKRNGGLLLQQQLSSNEGVVERTRIFSMSELDKATDHFNENRILGQGGQGTVYKGMLSDGSIVAIKKAKLLDESQLEQFINEVVILSQINHRNVVKLLGCCLESEIPLLVYEFIPNGTLFQHIHDPDEDFVLSWEMCLKIAADSAAAVAYLHSSASIPIYHRDIKSSNILLDEKHKAKVSDFGSSRTIAIDQTHMTTLVQGTMGYLDPEYFQSYQFTEKSDVYSFGVVLLELLTSKKPIYKDASTMEQKNLVTDFLFMTENSRLSEILDPKIVSEAKEDELIAIVELTKRCISWSGKLRPTMKEVAMTLEMIIKSPSQVSRWYQEQEPFPISDGGFDEYAMTDISDAELFSSTIPAGASSPPYNDVHPLLPDTK